MSKSKFDPHINEVAKMLCDGMTVREIADNLENYMDEIVDEGALYGFIRARKLVVVNANKKRVPNCDACDICFEIIGIDNKPRRTCHGAREIANGIKTSPQWCPKRERQAV